MRRSDIENALFEAYRLREQGINVDALIINLEEQLRTRVHQECDEERNRASQNARRKGPVKW